MDRRQFVIGAAASAGRHGPARRAPRMPSRPGPSPSSTRFRPAAPMIWSRGRWPSRSKPIVKQPVVVDTKAGAAGAVGAQVAASARPDGYTLLSHNNGLASYAEVDKLFDRPPKTTRADFIPLARLAADPVLLLVNEQQPLQDARGLCRRRQEAPRPDRLQFRRPLWREPPAGSDAGEGGGSAQDAAPADRRRRTGDHGDARQQCPCEHPDRVGVDPARQVRQVARAGELRRTAIESAA